MAQGLTVIARNYLEVYVYERWSDKEIIDYDDVAEFEPSDIDLVRGGTKAPNLLTEADLVSDNLYLLFIQGDQRLGSAGFHIQLNYPCAGNVVNQKWQSSWAGVRNSQVDNPVPVVSKVLFMGQKL